jgi:hypothetical protein
LTRAAVTDTSATHDCAGKADDSHFWKMEEIVHGAWLPRRAHTNVEFLFTEALEPISQNMPSKNSAHKPFIIVHTYNDKLRFAVGEIGQLLK